MLDLIIMYWFTAATLTAGAAPLPSFNAPSFSCGNFATSSEITYQPTQPTFCPMVQAGEICFATGGFYSVNLQLSTAPGPVASGSVTIDSSRVQGIFDPLPSTTFLLGFTAGPNYTLHGNTVVIQAQPQECMRLNYSATAPVNINTDPRATRMTIYKIK